METWSDSKIRVVSLNVLENMCRDVSGMCHRYQVSKVTANRVYVEYSNPDEYGNEYPMTAVFPLYVCQPGKISEVVLTFINIIHDYDDGEGWQNFQILLDCPSRNPNEKAAA
jgi:hypothetical protein